MVEPYHLASCFESTFLYFLQKPGDPELLFLERSCHEQHLLGSGGIIGDFARCQPLTSRFHALLVQLHTTACKTVLESYS